LNNPALRKNKMKVTKFSNLLGLGLVLTVAVTGCKTQHYGVTKLPENGTAGGNNGGISTAPTIDPNEKPLGTDNPTPIVDPNLRKDWPRDKEIFKADTVHFDYDSAVIKAADKSKVAAVADYLKANSLDCLEIDGHADERGTEEYNRALGERRALSLRDELARLGIDPTRIDTTSYGKDRPVDTGHSESAHKKNRRGEFLLEMHPK
jgi:outer membrane protein OmpA-like peptidoglycan-associated protein